MSSLRAVRAPLLAALACAAGAVAVAGACASGRPVRRTVGEECRSTRQDCSYGLECRTASASDPKPTLQDGGAIEDAGVRRTIEGAAADGGAPKTCQYAFFAECSEEPGGPTCVSGQRCREGHCTVMCAANEECGENQICKIGICQRKASALNQCYDNRDCPWPESCFHGQCVTRTDAYRCNSDLDCPQPYRCFNGRCQ